LLSLLLLLLLLLLLVLVLVLLLLLLLLLTPFPSTVPPSFFRSGVFDVPSLRFLPRT